MAGVAILGRANKVTIDVAAGTRRVDMCSGQWEGRQVVIERGRLPCGGRMAGSAVRSVFTGMPIIIRVTGKTHHRSTLELHIRVTGGAGNRGVSAREFEDRVVMVKGAWLPTIGRVTLRTLRAQRAHVRVIVMTGRTGGRRANEELITMTLRTRNSCVFTREQEGRHAVIKGGGRPAVHGMALRTLRAKFACVRIVLGVTGRALGRRTFELSAYVAALAGNTGMLAVEVEDRVVVIEGGRSPAFGRMTGLALISQ